MNEELLREELLKWIYKHSPVAYFPDPIPPQTATQEMVLQEFANWMILKMKETLQDKIRKVESLKRTDDTHLSEDRIYDEALQDTLSILKEGMDKK
jgi:hypothetical protein